MNSKKIDFRDLRVTLLKPLMVAERSQGRCWYPDLLKFSTGELMLNHSLNADRNDNAQDTQAVYLSTDELNNKIDEFEEISKTGHPHQLWSEVKNKAGLILGCDADEITYTRNAPEDASIICNGLRLQRSDEVITKHARARRQYCLLARAAQPQRHRGQDLHALTRSAQENVERIGALSISHVACATGQILPIKTIGELAAPHGIWYFVDGAQAPGMLPVDGRDIGCRLSHRRPQKAAWPQGHRPALRAPRRAQHYRPDLLRGRFGQWPLGTDQ